MKMKSPNKEKDKHKHLPKPTPIDKIKLQNKTACSAKADYYNKKIQRHRDMAEYHAGMAEQGIHVDYHEDKATHHRHMADKLAEQHKDKKPTKKDTGPMGSAPANAVGGAVGSF
jgi:hypothetical protein